MKHKKEIFAIIGSASQNSSNLKLIQRITALTQEEFVVTVFDQLKALPHFTPEQSLTDTPEIILNFRTHIAQADGILLCTPEYVFSIPSGLKNAIEWCVSTTVFSQKPTGIITASASGVKGHEELKLIMKTVEARFTEQTTLLISGIKAKINELGMITNAKAQEELCGFVESFKRLVEQEY